MVEIECPGIVRVPREAHEVGIRIESGLEHAITRGGVAIPSVHVERQFCPACHGSGNDPLANVVGQVFGQAFGEFGCSVEISHQHLLHQHLPRLARPGRAPEPVGKPGLLLHPQQFAAAITVIAVAEGDQRRHCRFGIRLPRKDIAIRKLLSARSEPGLEPEQRREIADLISRPIVVRHWHPFAIGLDRRSLADRPFALALALMVLRATFPRIIGAFVIVPAGDHRIELVQPAQVGIAAIGRITRPVIGQGDDFMRREQHPPRLRLLGPGIGARAVLIEIIAEVQRAIEVAIRRSVCIGVEPAEADVRTGEHRHTELVGLADRQRFRATDIRMRSVGCGESVIIPAPRFEPLGPGLAAPVVIRTRSDRASSRDARKVERFADREFELGILRTHETGPQQYAISRRLAAGDAVAEPGATGLRGEGGTGHPQPEDAALEQRATVERG